MTIICAYTDGTDTWIGSDLLAVRAGTRMILPQGKWVVHDGWALGTAGTMRAEVVQRREAHELFKNTEDPVEVCERLQAAYRKYGITSIRDERDGMEVFSAGAILARRGRIWDVDRSLTPVPWEPGRLLADGSAWEIAVGAAWARSRLDPRSIVEIAIKAAVACRPNTCEGSWVAVVPEGGTS